MMELQGIDEWVEALRQKFGEASERLENKGMRAAGQIMADAMVEKVAVGDQEHSVHMRDDIKVSGVRRKDGMKYVLIGPGKKTGWRAHFLEFGAIQVTRAQPFIYPSFHEKKNEAMQVMADEFRKGLSEG